MELKTIKEFCHKNNLGDGLEYSNDKFRVNLNNNLEITHINNLLNTINQTLNTVYKVNGSTTVDNINAMTVGNAMVGYVYNLLDSGVITNGLAGEVSVEAGDNVVYTDNGWDKLSAATKITLEAGNNISIEGNKISALGYVYDDSWESVFMVEGSGCEANGYLSFAHGNAAVADGEKSHAEGGQTNASGQLAHAEGSNTRAKGRISHTEGSSTTTYGESSHAEGDGTTAIGEASHSEGYNTTSVGNYSHAEGLGTSTRITGLSWVVGTNVVNIENASINIEVNDILKFSRTTVEIKRVIEKSETKIIVDSLIESPTNASVNLLEGVSYGLSSKVEGNCCIAIGSYSHAEGSNTEVKNESEHSQGFYNLSNIGTDEDPRTTLHSIGIGTSSDDRKNAQEVMNNGDTFIVGIGDYNGTNPYEAKTLQKVISDLGNTEYVTYTGSDTISISSDNEISVKGYWYNKTKEAIKTNLSANIATGLYSFAQNEGTQATGKSSHAEGGLTLAEGDYSHAEGSNTFTLGAHSHAEGCYTEACGTDSHAEGNGTLAIGSNSHSEGYKTVARGTCSHAEGSSEETEITGLTWDAGSHSLLMTDTSIRIYPDSILCFYADSKDYRKVVSVSGLLINLDNPLSYSSQDVWYTGIISGVAYGEGSHTEGLSTKSLGLASHAEGYYTVASGNYSHAEGYGTSTTNEYEHTEGCYNVSNIGTLHSIGIGTTSSNCKNAFEVMQNGDAYLIGTGGYDGTNPGEALTIQDLLNIKEYSLDFKEDLTIIQEINISNTWKLNQIIGYNVSSINLSIEGQETQVITLIDNNWTSDSLTTILIYPTNRIMWEIVKVDETLPAVLGISKIKL